MSDLQVLVEPMRVQDISYIELLEQACFPSPWSGDTYRNELAHNRLSSYWVLRPAPGEADELPPILAYGGYWLMGQEAHIVTIATHPNYRRRGFGRRLLQEMIERAHAAGAIEITLEVRVGNHTAQEMYKKMGFLAVGVRKKYYHDNGEDALLMTLFLTGDPFSASH